METRGKNRVGARIPTVTSPVGVTKVRFTPALWHKWLTEFNGEIDGDRIAERANGIKEFRALCREPLAHASENTYSAPTLEEKDK